MLVRATSSTTVLGPPAFHYRHSIQRLPLRADPSIMDYSQQEASLSYSSQPSQASSLPPRTPSPHFATSQPEPSIKPSTASQYSQSSQFATSSQPTMSRPFHHTKMTTKEREFFNRPMAYDFKRHVIPSYPPPDATPRPIVTHSQPTPLTHTDTLIIESPRPRSASPSLYPNPTCYRFPPVEPNGVFSQEGGEPKSKDYAYINPRIIKVKAPYVYQKTDPEINVDGPYNPFSSSQQRQSQSSSSSSQPRRVGGLVRENAFADDFDWFKDERASQGPTWPPPKVTESQEYRQNYVETPIVSPEGSHAFDFYNAQAAPTAQSYDLKEALMKASTDVEPQSMELGSAFEHRPHANLFSLSPLSSLASFSSMDTSSSGVFEEEIFGEDTPRHSRRVSAPCEAMQSLSLITPHSPIREGAPQGPTTSPSHGYSLRSNHRTVSASSSPSQSLPDSPFSSPRRSMRQRAQSGGRSPPPARRHTVDSHNRFDDPLSSSTRFELGARPRKRSRSDTDLEGSQSQLESSGNDADVSNVEDGVLGRRTTRTRSRKTRKLA